VNLDWTLLLVIDAALLAGATVVIIALFIRDLRRAPDGGPRRERE
jgi:hypothetical protein